MSGALIELAVTDLGIIDDLRLVFGPGMTVVSGETGAGKTLIVEAIDLLVGGRPAAEAALANAARSWWTSAGNTPTPAPPATRPMW